MPQPEAMDLDQEAVLARCRALVDAADPMMGPLLIVGEGSVGISLPFADGTPRDMLEFMAAAVLAGDLAPMGWALFACESWTAATSASEAVPETHRGELEERRRAGMGGVGEALVCHFVEDDGPGWNAIHQFDRVQPGTVIWGEAAVTEGSVSGAVCDALAMLVGKAPGG